MTADFFRVGAFGVDGKLRPALVVVVPLFALILGLALQPTTRWPSHARALFMAAGAVLSAGLVAGGLVGVLAWSHYGIGEGAASGFWCGAAFLPGMLAILAATRRVGRARAGSLVDRADRRAVWLAVFTTIALGTLAALPDWQIFPFMPFHPSVEGSRNLGYAALAMIMALLLGDVVDLLRAWRASVHLAAMRSCAPDDPALIWSPRKLDLGLGEAAAASVLAGPGLYRDRDRITHVVRGDARAARRALYGAVAAGLVALSVGMASLGMASGRPVVASSGAPAGVDRAPGSVLR
jgi:hypothetical protein